MFHHEHVRKPIPSAKAMLMTEGPIFRQLIYFTLPLLLGNVFQQLYNTCDSVIVGQFIGSDALAAVGSSSSIIFLITSLFMGISVGAGVVIAQHWGAEEPDRVEKAVHTTVLAGLIAGVLMTAVGVFFVPTLLRWMDTPEEVMPLSVLYFRIYFAGITPTMLYNMGSGIFRAVGDSKRPLYYLIASTIVNILLDLLFVGVFRWGVAGVAVATVIAQTCSMLLTFRALMTDDAPYRLRLNKLRLDRYELKQILVIGLPSGLQNCIVSLSNVVVQASINSFGAMAMAGCGAYNKIDGFALMPSGSFAMALTTFVGQNIGARKYDRVKKGARYGLITVMAFTELMGGVIYLVAPWLISIFNKDPEVIAYGTMMARNIVFGYCLVALSHGMAGVLRGAGKSTVPMLVMTFCWCVLRMIILKGILPFYHDIRLVFWVYPITWAVSSIVFIIYYTKGDWLHYRERQLEKELRRQNDAIGAD